MIFLPFFKVSYVPKVRKYIKGKYKAQALFALIFSYNKEIRNEIQNNITIKKFRENLLLRKSLHDFRKLKIQPKIIKGKVI